MLTKFIKLLSIVVLVSLISTPAFATGFELQNKSVISQQTSSGKYTNPLPIQIPNDGNVESCADPSILHSQTPGDNAWYMYCTTDPLNNNDKTGSDFNFHLIPMLSSFDLVHWTYKGDVFSARPVWVASNAGIMGPGN